MITNTPITNTGYYTGIHKKIMSFKLTRVQQVFPLKLLRIILVSSTESVRPHSAAVEKVHSSPKPNLREVDDPTTEKETAGADENSPVEDSSKMASGNSQPTNSSNIEKEPKKEKVDDSWWFFKYLLAKKLQDNPEYLILVQGLMASIFCYFLVGFSVWVFASSKANSVPNPFASISLEVNNEKDWSYLGWFWIKCFRWFFGPPPEVLNLKDAFPGMGIVAKHRIQNTNLSR